MHLVETQEQYGEEKREKRENGGLKKHWMLHSAQPSVCLCFSVHILYINIAHNTCEGGLCCDYGYDVFSVCGRDGYGLWQGKRIFALWRFLLWSAHTVHVNVRKKTRNENPRVARHGSFKKRQSNPRLSECVCEVSVVSGLWTDWFETEPCTIITRSERFPNWGPVTNPKDAKQHWKKSVDI